MANSLFEFTYSPKALSAPARAHFLQAAKNQLISRVKDAVSNLTKGILDVEGSIEGDTITLKILDLRSKSAKAAEKLNGYLNEVSEDTLFNIVSEDEFRNRAVAAARELHPELLRLLLESKALFSH